MSMTPADVGQLLLFASGFDRWIEVNQVNTMAWHELLRRYHYDDAKAAIRAFYGTWDGKAQLAPGVILHRVREATERDVRAARRLKLVDAGWSDHEPLDANIRQQVLEAGKRFNDETNAKIKAAIA